MGIVSPINILTQFAYKYKPLFVLISPISVAVELARQFSIHVEDFFQKFKQDLK